MKRRSCVSSATSPQRTTEVARKTSQFVFKRINYNESVRPKVYDRMISERRQIAERFLSEGNGEADSDHIET
jgi:regulator of protease activity HflC (stomatin/prohibitin superfamily)